MGEVYAVVTAKAAANTQARTYHFAIDAPEQAIREELKKSREAARKAARNDEQPGLETTVVRSAARVSAQIA